MNIAREIVSFLEVKEDIRGFASAVLNNGVIMYSQYVNGSPVRDEELYILYYPANGGKLKVFKLKEFQNGSGFAPGVICSRKPKEKGLKKENPRICGPASLLVLTRIPFI